jgi:hypothetical protein
MMKCQEEGGQTSHTNIASHPVREEAIKATSIKLTATFLPKSVLVVIVAPAVRAVREVQMAQL